jgi:hypothetical protein
MQRITLFVGQTSGKLSITECLHSGKYGAKCSCGSSITLRASRFAARKSCGKCPREAIQVGNVFHWLTVKAIGKMRGSVECECVCGTLLTAYASRLLSGERKSCGCSALPKGCVRTHGMSKTPEYVIWVGMSERCRNPNGEGFQRYGGRGITVCERWRSFEAFYLDMGNRPSQLHSIERINNDGNYEPGNCRWATRAEQNRNTRRTVRLTHDGRTLPLVDWARSLGLEPSSLSGRLKNGWTLPEALTVKRLNSPSARVPWCPVESGMRGKR